MNEEEIRAAFEVELHTGACEQCQASYHQYCDVHSYAEDGFRAAIEWLEREGRIKHPDTVEFERIIRHAD